MRFAEVLHNVFQGFLDMGQAFRIAPIKFFLPFLGLINLLPIPVLDGGHLLFYGIEAIWGKPVPEKVQEYAFIVGLVIVLGVMLISTWNDVVRLILR